jgi:hypothetical protein
MTAAYELDDDTRRYLVALCETTAGDTAAQVSMYAIGERLGFDRTAAGHLAENLIGWDLVEVRTLSGGVGITAEGVTEARRSGAHLPGAAEPGPRLGDGPVVDAAAREAVEQVASELKVGLGGFGLTADGLTELLIDLKTIDVQLTSPRPKTAIVRECLRSVSRLLATAGQGAAAERVRLFLED